MQKTQIFKDMHLVAEGLREINEYLTRPGGMLERCHQGLLEVTFPNGMTWRHDAFFSFLADYPQAISAQYERWTASRAIKIINIDDRRWRGSVVTVTSPLREQIEKVFKIIEKYREQSTRRPVEPVRLSFLTGGYRRRVVQRRRRKTKRFCREPLRGNRQ